MDRINFNAPRERDLIRKNPEKIKMGFDTQNGKSEETL